MNQGDRWYVAVPTRDRKEVVAQCLPTIRDMLHPDDVLVVYDDSSLTYGYKFLERWATVVHREPQPIGIEAQRRKHFQAFLATELPYLYLTDSDCLCDPELRSQAMRLQQKYGNCPLCLYNTVAHASLKGNTIEDDPASEVIWRRVAPGISYLLTREHVEQIRPHLGYLDHFDWMVPAILGHRMAISRVSYADHLGWGGMHHPTADGLDGGDRCLSPTPWLVRKRAEVVEKLKNQ